LKRTRGQTDLVAVGDRGRVEDRSGTPAIVEVLPRRSKLSRRAPDPHRARTGSTHEQIIVANPDLAVFGFACYDPDPHLRMLDRYLVCAEVEALPAVVVANKIDLSAPGEAREKFGLYERLGYPVHYTCALTGIGVEPLRERLKHGLSVLSGPSGVGKSSLLNAMHSGLGLEAKAVSTVTGKGRHTTVTIQMLPFEDGYIADTPGVRALGLWDVQADQIAWGFVEFRPYLGQYKFNDYRHGDEPGCAVRAAVERGEVMRGCHPLIRFRRRRLLQTSIRASSMVQCSQLSLGPCEWTCSKDSTPNSAKRSKPKTVRC
jgi:ribosome biogenesis GTPase